MAQRWLKKVVRTRIIVHTAFDQTYEGLLAQECRDGIVLKTAELIENGGKKTPLPGEAWIPRESIVLIQLDR